MSKRITIVRQLMKIASDAETDIRSAVPNGWVTESERACYLDEDDFKSWADKAFFIARNDVDKGRTPSEGRKYFLQRLRKYEAEWKELADKL